ncbi:MAG TPA: inner membrane protein YiaA [Leptospiraceae bacterium]|nr:inner membrane protein YiaA [Leptospiraceae bacterium]HMY65142.1 inner membrane protein YiaA [Leptospiraceae bacterium]HNF15269.1 inner membrane protein YiaA [Leptospiraceae bacterium]HNF23126.1 inner membrane protein YiaA [Leptospiraceae bacterium]HNH08097.1 inner membrane protein YiaA [Leptospiraceae bacterium]
MQSIPQKPSSAFIAISWLSLFVGMITFIIGIWSTKMMLNEKGFYLTVLLYGLFSSVSLQKTVRDQLEGLFVTGIYVGLCWFSVGASLLLLLIGLWNAELALSEKGFLGISYVLSLYAAVAVQKNVRDSRLADMQAGKFSDKE